MSGNLWSVLNNVADDTENGKIKFKKPANQNANKKKAAPKKPTDAPNRGASGGASNKPQLTAKAARAFRDGQHPKKVKAPQPQQQKRPAPAGVAAKSQAPAAAPQGPAMVVKKPAPSSASVPQLAPAQTSAQSQQKIQAFQKALNSVLNGPSAFFQASLMRSSEVSVLQNNPYRVVGDMVKSPQFATNLGLALKRDAKEITKKDVRTKILGRVNRVSLAHHMLSLLTGYSPVNRTKLDEEAVRLVTGFFEALWNLPPPPEPVKRVQVERVDDGVADEEDEEIGSAGNVKREMTLSDFIKPAKVKGGKKGKGQQAAQTADASPATPAAAAPAAPAAAEPKVEAQPQAEPAPLPSTGTKDDPTTWRPDLLASAKELSRRIPSNIQCVRVEPSFLWSAEEVKASGKQQQYYFKNSGCDHVYAFWEDGKGDIHFLLTTGSA